MKWDDGLDQWRQCGGPAFPIPQRWALTAMREKAGLSDALTLGNRNIQAKDGTMVFRYRTAGSAAV